MRWQQIKSQGEVLIKMLAVSALFLASAQLAQAQLRIVGSISGTVQDQTGAVIPNASVVLKDIKTGIKKETVSTGSGTFLFSDLATGLYEVTVAATGFQTSVVPEITVSTNQTTDIRVSLEVGVATQVVTVDGGPSQTLETSSQLMASTLLPETITELPLANRGNILTLARLSPGASPPIGGDTRYNNLAGGAVNVTIDGINNASNGFKSGGNVFFATVPVRLGAVEEVTVETGGLGADSGAQSGANIKFTTKRGGKEYHGSVFYEPRSEQFNANSWSRNAQGLDRGYERWHDYGGNIGGPLLPFGSFKEKLFFFVNYERSYHPLTNSRTVTVLTPEAQDGFFTYLVDGTTDQFRTVNVLTIAGDRGLPTTRDRVTQDILAINNQVRQFATQIPDGILNRDSYTWNAENNQTEYFPATRVDYFVTPKQQVSFTWNYRHSWQPGERRLPVPDIQRTNPFRIGYFAYSGALQSTFSTKIINEFRYGVQHSGDTNTRDEYGPYHQYNGVPLRIGGNLQFANGAAPNPISPTVPFIDQANVAGRHYITTIYDTMTLNSGQHTITLGGSYRKTDWKDVGIVYPVPTYTTGTPAGDPLQVANAFTTDTIPGINPNQLGTAVGLYNLLTGRVAAANFQRVVNPDTLKYDGIQNFTWTSSLMGGLYAQDRWRIRPSLTLNYGLRWEVQGPMNDVKGITAAPDLASLFGPSKRLFAPGELSGNNNPTVEVGRVPYKTDWLNFAPNFGFAWNPTMSKGILGKLFGDAKTVFRGSYSVIVYDEGTQMFAANLGPNAGKTINATPLVPGRPGQTSLRAFYTLSDIVADPLTASSFAFTTTDYKQVINQADQTFARDLRGFDPTLRAPYTVNWTFGIQRELWKNTALEIRYVGNQSKLAWRTSNLNEVNIFENGFLQEFNNAKNNLAINQAAGVNSFQNRGLPGQVPLPIFDAAFGPRGSIGAIAAGSGYNSTAFITDLQNGAAGGLANALATNSDYVCRMFGNTFSPCLRIDPRYNAPGPYPINFFLLNPYSAGRINYVDDTGWHGYNGLQIQFRQRFSKGLNWTTNYTWSKSLTNLNADNQTQGRDFTTWRDIGRDRRVSFFDITHVFQSSGTYDLPVGRGRWLSVNNRLLDAVVGGWTLGSIFVLHTGQPIQLTGGFQTVNANNNFSNGVRLAPGVTLEQIQEMFDAPQTRLIRPGITDLQRLAVDPRLVGPDGRANPQYLLPNTTPGEFGQLLFLRDKNRFQWDVSMTKTFQFTEKVRFQVFAGFNNVLNHPRWSFGGNIDNPPGALNVFSTTFGVIGAPGDSRSMNLRATLSF
jgi:Carboxypeptidase regulatory-like domain